MDLQWKVKEGTLYIQVPGELDHHAAAVVCAQADRLIKMQDIRAVVFDFGRTVFCDSSVIGMLMGRYKMMQALGGSVRAVGVHERVEKIFMLSGVTKFIPAERV